MPTRTRRTFLAVSVFVVLAGLISSASARPYLPLGAGAWGPSTNVSSDEGCRRILSALSSDCGIYADSFELGVGAIGGIETCNTATVLVVGPATVDFDCNVSFSATLRSAGVTQSPVITSPVDLPLDDNEVEIESGACAGLTLSDATITVFDEAIGTYSMRARVTVNPTSWSIEGHYTYLDVASASLIVMHVTGKIAPGCTRASTWTPSGFERGINFMGGFSGMYQTL